MPRLNEGQHITKESIELLEEWGVFSVKSASDECITYRVCFNENGMPDCECFDWKRHHLPCKHFCAIFHQFKNYSWDTMAPDYKDSLYFKLDEDIVGVHVESDSHDFVSIQSEDIETEPQVLSDVLDEDKTAIHKAIQCREILQQLTNLTYLSEDTLSLHTLHTNLIKMYTEFSKSIPAESGLLLNPVSIPIQQNRKNKKRGAGTIVTFYAQ